jgi:hypothetical protein
MSPSSLVAETLAEVNALANAQFESSEFRQLLGKRLTMARARFFTIEMGRYVNNRRDCWGYVQGAAPLDVKRLIWAHEQEELVLDPNVGMDHYTLATREAEVLGLTPADFEQAAACPGSIAAFYAWTYLAKDRPWLEALAASSVLEVRNSAAVVTGGSLSSRIRQKLVDDLGLPAEKLINVNRHSVADEEHASLLERVVGAHVATDADRQAVLRGGRASFLIDRAFRGSLAAGMAALD